MRSIHLFLFFVCFVLPFSCTQNEGPAPGRSHNLPILELTIEPHHLWSQDSGLYIIGSNGLERCNLVANFNQNWEYPIQAKYVVEGNTIFDDKVGFRIRGNCSRQEAMKSFGLYWRSQYGINRLEHRIFIGSDTWRYKRLLFRNSGQDFVRTMMKDAVIQRAVRFHGDFEYQEYQPVVVYINGEYWGIHNMRDMINARYFQYKFGVDNEKVDLLTGSDLDPRASEGSIDDFMSEVIDFIKVNDLSDDNNYMTLQERIDMSSYIDYFVVQTYIMNRDWPKNNIRWWREKTSADYRKWRYVIYDLDLAMSFNWDDKVWIGDWYNNYIDENKVDGFFIFNELIKNKNFKESFLDRYDYFLDHVFLPARFEQLVRETQEAIREEYPFHAARWNTLLPSAWDRSVNVIIRFNERRHSLMKIIIKELRDEL